MKLYVKQSVFTLGEKFTIKNERGEDMYYVEGSFMSIPKNFSIYDHNHNLVARIEKQLFRFLPHYNIQLSDREVVIRRNFTFFKMEVEILNSNWILQGDFFAHEYSVVSADHPIMYLSKEWFTWGDSYELNIGDPDDAPLCIAIAVVVDHLLIQQNNN